MIPQRSADGVLTSKLSFASRHILNVAGTLIALGLIAILAYCTWALIHVEIPQPNNNAFMVLLGILSGSIMNIVSFFFGSSIVSKQQTDIIEKQAEEAKDIRQMANPKKEADVQLEPGETATVESVPNT